MAETKIQWSDTVWNPITGCTPVSEGCTNCYAAQLAATRLKDKPRYAGLAQVNSRGVGVFNGKINLHEDKLLDPLKWRKPRRVFVNSMSDLFHEDVPFEFVDKVFAVMALAPQHTFQVLTKRPERMAEYLAVRANVDRKYWPEEVWVQMHACLDEKKWPHEKWDDGELCRWPLPYVWLGTSVEHQDAANERIPHLLRCPAAVRFLSCEPLLGPIRLDADMDWVIVGGESGKHARPCNIEWIRLIVAQCRLAGVPVFVKQLGRAPVGATVTDSHGGDLAEWPADLQVREFPEVSIGENELYNEVLEQ